MPPISYAPNPAECRWVGPGVSDLECNTCVLGYQTASRRMAQYDTVKCGWGPLFVSPAAYEASPRRDVVQRLKRNRIGCLTATQRILNAPYQASATEIDLIACPPLIGY